MNRHVQQSDLSSSSAETVAGCIEQIEAFALQEFDRQIQRHQLYYHTRDHIRQVQRRSRLIFDAIRPDLDPASIEHLEQLLDLCVIAHDMVQIFEAQPQPHAARSRTSGVSETATIDRLLDYIDAHNAAQFCEQDRATIQAAIGATICAYDAKEQSIYQPALSQPNLPIVARILALADLNALGIDGIEMYNREGSLLFLEENLDVIPLILNGTIDTLETTNATLARNIQQRLLKRCRFQVNFAKSRAARLNQEIAGFPQASIATLRNQVFQHLNPATLQELEATTPTDDNTPLGELLRFFEFDRYLKTA